jgi:hypothetical protein
MKYIDFSTVIRTFGYAMILFVMFILQAHKHNSFLWILGFLFLSFSLIESSVTYISKQITFKELIFSKLQQTRISNVLRGLALISFLSQLSLIILK